MSIVKLDQKRKQARRDAKAADRVNVQGRDVPFALVAVALIVGGMALGGSLSARQEPPSTQPPRTSPAVPAPQFDYFPSHYVNQGVESSQEIPTF